MWKKIRRYLYTTLKKNQNHTFGNKGKRPNRHIIEIVDTRSYFKEAQRCPKGAYFPSAISSEWRSLSRVQNLLRSQFEVQDLPQSLLGAQNLANIRDGLKKF